MGRGHHTTRFCNDNIRVYENRGKKRTERVEENSKTYNDTSREEASTHAHAHIQCTYLQVCMIAAVHTAATGNAVKIAVQAEEPHVPTQARFKPEVTFISKMCIVCIYNISVFPEYLREVN